MIIRVRAPVLVVNESCDTKSDESIQLATRVRAHRVHMTHAAPFGTPSAPLCSHASLFFPSPQPLPLPQSLIGR